MSQWKKKYGVLSHNWAGIPDLLLNSCVTDPEYITQLHQDKNDTTYLYKVYCAV